jgi:hypothetical protein
MKKQTILTTISLLAICALIVGVYEYIYKKGVEKVTQNSQIEITKVSENQDTASTSQQADGVPEVSPSPYVDLDPKLHIMKGVVLDPNIVQINYELKDLKLCGGTYKAKQVIIDGVDVVQRLSQLLLEKQKTNDWFCEILKSDAKRSGGMITEGEEINVSIDGTAHGNLSYRVSLGVSMIDYTSVKPYSMVFGFGGTAIPQKNGIFGIDGFYYGTLH